MLANGTHAQSDRREACIRASRRGASCSGCRWCPRARGDSAVHTATDIPLSAFGPGAWAFTGVMDNTDVFFKLAQAALMGAAAPEGMVLATKQTRRKP